MKEPKTSRLTPDDGRPGNDTGRRPPLRGRPVVRVRCREKAEVSRACACGSAEVASASPGSALRFTVAGNPVPKARARRGKGGRHYTPPKTRAFEQRVRWAGIAAASVAGWKPAAGASYALALFVVFPDRRPKDLDNVLKSVSDALNGVAWLDDAQVHELTVRRSIDRTAPRVEVQIRRIPNDGKPSFALNSIPNRAQVREKQQFTTGSQPVGPVVRAPAALVLRAQTPHERAFSSPTTSGPTRVAIVRQRGAQARLSLVVPGELIVAYDETRSRPWVALYGQRTARHSFDGFGAFGATWQSALDALEAHVAAWIAEGRKGGVN
jgi:crossover junction endodeoxyribonuclease RusA